MDGNSSMLNHIADVVMSDIDMLDTSISLRVLSKRHCSCVVIVEVVGNQPRPSRNT